MIESGGLPPNPYLSVTSPMPLLHIAGGIITSCYRAVEPMQAIVRHGDMHLAYSTCIDILILSGKLSTGNKRKNNKTKVKEPQDFMQTLIPQIGSNLVLRLLLL